LLCKNPPELEQLKKWISYAKVEKRTQQDSKYGVLDTGMQLRCRAESCGIRLPGGFDRQVNEGGSSCCPGP